MGKGQVFGEGLRKRGRQMSEPKTKTGAPRKRAPGAGRPYAGRSVSLPRVSPETREALGEIQLALWTPGQRSPTLADAVEWAVSRAVNLLRGPH